MCVRGHGCIGVGGGCKCSPHCMCHTVVMGEGGTSCALDVLGFWGRLVCPASLMFYCVCCGDMGVPQVHPIWDLWSVFVEF